LVAENNKYYYLTIETKNTNERYNTEKIDTRADPPPNADSVFLGINDDGVVYTKDSNDNVTVYPTEGGGGGGGGGFSYYDNGNSSQNTEIDWSRASLQKIAIDNNPTLSFTGATAGQKLTLLLKQVIGEGKKTITWSDGVFWRDGETFRLKKVNNVPLDESFEIGDGFNSGVQTIALQPDGKILVGGGFTEFDGNAANYLVRLNADGSRDTGFDIGTGFNGGVLSIALQPDGKILVGGQFTSFDGNAANRLVRLNADGSIDTGFGIGDGFSGTVRSIALQPDGRILVGGGFTGFDGNTTNGMARLNADGTLDSGFDMSNGFTGSKGVGVIISIALQPDGKILVGGEFTGFDGNTVNKMARLNADGTLDSGFDMSTGFNSDVFSIALQPDGKILAGGQFTSLDGLTANGLARLVELTGDVYSPVDLYYTGDEYIGTY